MALPLRAGGRRPPPSPRRSWRGLVAQRIGYGSSAAPLAKRHHGALAPVRIERVERRRLGAASAAGHPVVGLAVAGGTAAALVRKLPGVPATESLRLAGARPPLRRSAAGRRRPRRAWWPVLVAGAVVSPRVRRIAALSVVPALLGGGLPRLVDDLAYGVGVWKGVLAERELGPDHAALHVVARADSRRRRPLRSAQSAHTDSGHEAPAHQTGEDDAAEADAAEHGLERGGDAEQHEQATMATTGRRATRRSTRRR